MPDYSNGKIYKIVNTVNDKVYIGSTTQRLSARMTIHRNQAINLNWQCGKLFSAMRRHGHTNFQIELIKDYPCNTKQQLETKEFQIIKKYLSKGIVLYNTTVTQGRVSEETKQKQRRITGAAVKGFKRGGVYPHASGIWLFKWYESGKPRTKSFSINKYGSEEAKRMAEEYRDIVFPIE